MLTIPFEILLAFSSSTKDGPGGFKGAQGAPFPGLSRRILEILENTYPQRFTPRPLFDGVSLLFSTKSDLTDAVRMSQNMTDMIASLSIRAVCCYDGPYYLECPAD